jgi:hypothetical protein
MAKLPVYKLVINDTEESGVDIISFVDSPAIEQDFMVFSSKELDYSFKTDPTRRIVTGAMMLADTPIYRNQGGEEFMVVFDKQTIEKIAQKFFKQGNGNNVNVMHTTDVSGVSLFESFITDSQRGIQAPKGYPKVPEGSWFGSYHITNNEVWASVLDGTFKGFSVEGVFNKVPVKMKTQRIDWFDNL